MALTFAIELLGTFLTVDIAVLRVPVGGFYRFNASVFL